MKKISIYVNEELDGAVDKSISKLIDFICDNDMEIVNIKQEEIPVLSNEGINFESNENGYVVRTM